MADSRSNAASASFRKSLHRALRDLYDPGELAKSPLLDLFSLGGQPDPPAALRRLLLAAIDGLKPPADLPPQANARRTYSILLHRYVQQIAQREIAASLGFSVRQLQRHEQVALQALADYLWACHGLELKAGHAELEEAGAPGARAGAASQEMRRLASSFGSEAVGIGELVQSALETVAPLLAEAGVRVEPQLEGLPHLAVQRIPMRQALVSLLTVAAHHARGGQVLIGGAAEPAQVRVSVRAVGGVPAKAAGAGDSENLAMARQLVGLSGGSLQLMPRTEAGTGFAASLMLPAAQQLGVLVIDDNVDALRLCRRYLEGSRYAFVGARNPERALELAREVVPKVIVLDVMLPGMDGWEVLGRLREHPATRRIPVIVSTILPHEQLALTLGAAAFLRKPIGREALIEALDAQLTGTRGVSREFQ